MKEKLNKQKQKNKASVCLLWISAMVFLYVFLQEDVLQSEVKDMLRKNQELEDRNCQLAAVGRLNN